MDDANMDAQVVGDDDLKDDQTIADAHEALEQELDGELYNSLEGSDTAVEADSTPSE